VYTDASANARVIDLLLQLGWDVETAQQAGLTGKIDDVVWIRYAKKHGRIAITFDELKGQQGEKVSRELRQRGGNVLRVQGGPEQNKYRAVGKLLFHYPEWYPFLSASDGVSVISDVRRQSCRSYTPEQYHQHCHPVDAEQFTEYLKSRRQRKPYRPRKRKTKPPDAAQEPLPQPPSVPPTTSE